MKITKKQLRQIIREEVKTLNETTGVIAGLGFGQHGRGMTHHHRGTLGNSSSSVAAVALNRNRRTLVQEYMSGDEEILLRRAVDSYVDGYMLRMSMNPGDANDRQRIRRQVGDLVGRQLDAFLGED